jgi:beta-glucosidase
MKIKTQWNKPVLITENGIADKSDRYRAPFIVAHLHKIKQAIDDGADNYRPEGKFGLFSIDRNTGDRNGQHHKQLDLSRQKTKGAEAFELIIKESLSQSKVGVVTDSAAKTLA